MRKLWCTMTTQTTKAPRPTLEQRRQADIESGVIKLSPSSLTFLHDECPACFWHHYNGRPLFAQSACKNRTALPMRLVEVPGSSPVTPTTFASRHRPTIVPARPAVSGGRDAHGGLGRAE